MESGQAGINPELLLSYDFPETTYSYTERDAALYALGVGACGKDAVDAAELKYIFHQDGQQFVKVLPTFASLLSVACVPGLPELPGLKFDLRLLLHGQQYIEIYRPFLPNGCILSKTSIIGLHDKGKAAVLELETLSSDKESGQPLCMNRLTLFIRGVGGFSRSGHRYSYSKYQNNPVTAALLNRLSGDYNPLHCDPSAAKLAGFSGPILPGLCVLGFAVRAIIRCLCKGDPDMVKSVSARFLLHVFPGETLITEMWLDGLRVVYQVKVKERNEAAVLAGQVDLNRLPSHL
ncbi:hypothetical protein Ancab_035400 [Ancistrocladus abbreviatus]